MNSKVPTVRQVAWISIIPQFIILGIIMWIWSQFDSANFFLFGALTYWLISQILRRSISKEHRKGMAKVRTEKFSEAIQHFEVSYDFFKQNDWIDKYRFLTLLSSGKMSFKEMALNNIAFCYGQIGNGKRSKEYYQKALDENPDNELAKTALRMLNSMTKDE